MTAEVQYYQYIDEHTFPRLLGNPISNGSLTVQNPKYNDYVLLGFDPKTLYFRPKPEFDPIKEKLVETYENTEGVIIVNYTVANLTEEPTVEDPGFIHSPIKQSFTIVWQDYINNKYKKEIKDILDTYKKEDLKTVDDINSYCDFKILTGHVYKDMAVWLSTENQFNYKAAWDLCFQTNGANLPVTFKFGTDLSPVYYEFTTSEELQYFIIGLMQYIKQQLGECWEAKSSLIQQ